MTSKGSRWTKSDKPRLTKMVEVNRAEVTVYQPHSDNLELSLELRLNDINTQERISFNLNERVIRAIYVGIVKNILHHDSHVELSEHNVSDGFMRRIHEDRIQHIRSILDSEASQFDKAVAALRQKKNG